jgi:hypothetical protein
VFLFCLVLALSSSPTSGDEEVRYQYMECSEPVIVGAPQKKMIIIISVYYLVACLALCGGKEDIACTPDKVSDYAPQCVSFGMIASFTVTFLVAKRHITYMMIVGSLLSRAYSEIC